jgi:hypothetical protein
MDFWKKFLVGSHVKFKLSNIDPAYKGTHENHLNDWYVGLGPIGNNTTISFHHFARGSCQRSRRPSTDAALILRALRAI